MGIHISRHLKEEQTWATDKWLAVIIINTTKEPMIKAVLSLKQHWMHCCTVLS